MAAHDDDSPDSARPGDQPPPWWQTRRWIIGIGGAAIAAVFIIGGIVNTTGGTGDQGVQSPPAPAPSTASATAPTPTLSAAEQRFIDALPDDLYLGGADDSDDTGLNETLADGWTICTGNSHGYGDTTFVGDVQIIEGPPTVEDLRRNSDSPLYRAAVTHLCPRYLPRWRAAQKQAADSFEDGNWEIGKDIKPGTYRTERRAVNCYWERSTAGGETIANAFVTNAPQGATVTIRATDGGFTSTGCGTWLRVR